MELARAKWYFVSDLHLGLDPDTEEALQRKFINFLRSIPDDAEGLYLLGDIFDFWAEYKTVIPKGYTRVLGALAELADRGIEVRFMRGNHDYWIGDYFEKELGITTVLEEPQVVTLAGKQFCLAHGDALGNHSVPFLFITWMFRNPLCIALMKLLPPKWVTRFAHRWSASSRLKHSESPYQFRGRDDRLYKYANRFGKHQPIDYYVFGHIHSPAQISVASGGRLMILGDWIDHADYLALDSEGEVKRYKIQ